MEYKNFKYTASNGDTYLVEYYPETRAEFQRHVLFSGFRSAFPPRNVVRLEAPNGATPQKGNTGKFIFKGIPEGSVVGVAFNAATNEVIGMQLAARSWAHNPEKPQDEMYGEEYLYGGTTSQKLTPEKSVPEDIKLALDAAKNAWRSPAPKAFS